MNRSAYQLDPEEQEILDAYDQGRLHPIPDAEIYIREAAEIARNTLNAMNDALAQSDPASPPCAPHLPRPDCR